ncbi:2OG-Fe(II) oxygenase [Permianibacter aggregans]|uniref:2-oxoglutarate-Fe(II)-dependent oxygenase superfamily protein n=1 Tax=Permianibacter aggregans TaxID=1510150 RepID=A0A4R6V544_9GAMM|nr:2OG-Fe(II) oxygenase [Permianibacter aggregans]QGX41501.1 2OG-Fe(II) oxygenase [Permianibacter aggregans]TDQ51294.1 2-oxoglutarate-Fe(II)-dependent oxygenase superfamily protein [Permianibacter aggregans]
MLTPSLWQDFIAVYDDVLPAEFCQRLMREFDRSPHRVPGRTGHGVDASKKVSEDISLNYHADWSDTLTELLQLSYPPLEQYLSRLKFPIIGAVSPTVNDPQTGKPATLSLENFDRLATPMLPDLIGYLYRYGLMNLQKYQAGKGGYFHWHSEVYPQDEKCEPLHRVLLFMFYLNDVAEGGETEFYYQNLKIAPKAGRMVIAPAGFTHTHRGNMPVSNDKYIATSWVMFHRAEQLYQRPQNS